MSKIKDHLINKQAKYDREGFEFLDMLYRRLSPKQIKRKIKEMREDRLSR